MMKNKAFFVLVISALMTIYLAGNVIAAPHVDNISLKKQGEFVELTVYADGPFTFNHFIEEAKAGKPFRVVLDLKGCLHKLPQFNFRELPTQVISSIRTSQYKIKPEKIVRIVADIPKPVTYMVKQSEGSVTLVFAAPSEKEFEFWCAAPLSDPEKIELALKETKSEEVGSPVVMPANPDIQKKAEDNNKFKPPIITEEQKKSGLQLAQKPQTPKKRQNEKPESIKKAKTESKSDKNETVGLAKTELSSEERHALKEKLAGIFKNRSNKETKENKQVEPSVVRKQEKGASEPVVVAQADIKKEETKTAHKRKVTEPKKEVKKVVPDQKSLLTDSQPVTPVQHDADAIGNKNKVVPITPSVPVEDIHKAKQKDWKSEKDLRKNPDRPPKSKGSLAASFPEREVVRYRSYGRRDPFMALVSKAITGYQNGELPDIETLRLVGVLNGDATNMALLEDIEGYGYILEDGDKIKNGYVIQIYNNKILFQINEMGWSRSVALTLDVED